jgi:protein TonB
MKYVIIHFLFICSVLKSYGQDSSKIDHHSPIVDTSKSLSRDSVLSKVDVQPDFDGGRKAWMEFVAKNLNPNVPVDNKAPKGAYTVIIKFIVYDDGAIDKLEALTHHGYGMEQEVIRILKLTPKWKPAMQNRKIVNSYRKLPVTFVVQ